MQVIIILLLLVILFYVFLIYKKMKYKPVQLYYKIINTFDESELYDAMHSVKGDDALADIIRRNKTKF